MEYTLNNGQPNPGNEGFKGNTKQQMAVVDWLSDLHETRLETDLVEVKFKNTRKGYFVNSNKVDIAKGDVVVVEASPGHDVGEVTLMGRLVLAQIKKTALNMDRYEIKRVYRVARPSDIEKYEESKAKEHATMIRARKIAEELNLAMKIGDVEYQGDGLKAIFYYIADGRVDFRQLIKVFADVFRVKIEMKQIGARQEAGRIGGYGPCGRELCCTTFMSNFVSVSTNVARIQDLGSNPLKLAGQCAKIKCCINFETPVYKDLQADIPPKDIQLETKDSVYYHFKTDIFKKLMTYSTAPNIPANLVVLPVEKVKEIIKLNKKGIRPKSLENESAKKVEPQVDFLNVVGQDSLNRFDNTKKKKRNNNNKKRK